VHGPPKYLGVSKRHQVRLSLQDTHIIMSKARTATDQIVKLIVGAGQASPSPPVGPALGSKGVKSMDFCKVSSSSHPPSTNSPFHLPLTPSKYKLTIPAGIQRPHSTHGPRNPHPIPRNRPTGPLLSLRDPDSHNELAALECSGSRVEKGEAKGRGWE
jgi:hypothetical protein